MSESNTFDIRCADAIELVTDYLDDALDSGDLAAFTSHIAGCEGCTIFVDQIRMTIQLTSATGERLDVMPPGFDDLLLELRRNSAASDGDSPKESETDRETGGR